MNNLTVILYTILAFAVCAVVILFVALCVLTIKRKKKDKDENIMHDTENKPVENKNSKTAKEYDAKSIFDFMEFENVKDNMIIQKKGKKFLMVIECQGINYDLMSDVEKAATEQGFASFLNTLKDPIQIYIQTRTVNLEKNIQEYKARLEKIKSELTLKEYKLKQYMENGNIDNKIFNDKKFEVFRETNLYDYGRDIIADTERMSLNKNVLKKKYYIILRYYYETTDTEGEEVLSQEEIEDTAFSNLYTRASSMIRVLTGVGIVGKVLNSFELVDLLYNAYNRDDSETFGVEKAIDSGFNEIYIDAQSAIDKKIEALNREIEFKAEEAVRDSIEEIEDEKSRELKDLEDNISDIILDLAKQMIDDEKNNLPQEVKEKAKKKIETKIKGKGEKKVNGKEKTKETNRRNRAS